MTMHQYRAWNAPMPTTAAIAKVTTGTAVKTMLQLATPSTRMIRLVEWGFTLDTNPAGIGIVELLQANVAATVTAHVASGVQPLNPGAPASLLTLGVSATGYTSTAEGTITASRVLDSKLVPNANTGDSLTYVYQWVPDARPIIAVSSFVRVRTTFASASNMLTYVVWEE